MGNRIFSKSSITNEDNLKDLLSQTHNENGCFVWDRSRNTDGYPRMGGNVKVHRLVYELSSGEDIKGLVVRHTCDNPKCINPEHLLKGTPRDNVQDRVDRGRYRQVVTLSVVQKVNKLLDTKLLLCKEISKIIGIDARRVSDIKNGKYCSATGKFLGHG